MERRTLLKSLPLGMIAPALAPLVARAEAEAQGNPARAASNPGRFTEPARDLPLTADTDVIVCGAGPAGVTAAIAAARAGAKVRLFEAHGSLGGV